jgi:hypothetical protein
MLEAEKGISFFELDVLYEKFGILEKKRFGGRRVLVTCQDLIY